MTLCFLYTADGIRKHIIHDKMVSYAKASARSTDDAENRVIMDGKPGYLGYSSVYLSYLKDGWISVVGDNVEESSGWRLLSAFTLEPGAYTLTGLKGQHENTIALQLRIEDDTGYHHYFYQYDEDVSFTIKRQVDAALHVRVYPEVERIDTMARPAVYRDE